jgi:hypothetical protein
MFQKRHFKVLAAWVCSRADVPEAACLSLAIMLKMHSRHFKAVRFFQACGYSRDDANRLAERVDRECVI